MHKHFIFDALSLINYYVKNKNQGFKMFNLDKVIPILKQEFDKKQAPIVDLIKAQTKDPFKVLVATILSARTKDQTTAQACTKLFKQVNSVYDLQKLEIEQIQELIYPVGFYRQKAKALKKLPEILIEKFNAQVPKTIDELLELPGVGRKTANLVLAIGFELPAICVDVHMHRIFNRWQYVNTKTPFDTEMALRQKLPQKYWLMVNSYVVSFGQTICAPRNPKCCNCPIAQYCPAFNC